MTAIRTYPDEDSLAQAATEHFLTLAGEAVAARGRFVVALSGGRTPKRLYELLARPPWRQRIPWTRVHIFWGDERCVPPNHPDSNYRLAREPSWAKSPSSLRMYIASEGNCHPNKRLKFTARNCRTCWEPRSASTWFC